MDWRPMSWADDSVEPGTPRALQTRTVIGQATGILMHRDRLSAEQAFARLVDISQRSNTKLHEVARHLVSQIEEGFRSR